MCILRRFSFAMLSLTVLVSPTLIANDLTFFPLGTHPIGPEAYESASGWTNPNTTPTV